MNVTLSWSYRVEWRRIDNFLLGENTYNPVRRILTTYAFLTSLLSGCAYMGLANLSESLIDLWNYTNPDSRELPNLTTVMPTVNRVALVIPIAVFFLELVSLKRKTLERYLIHATAISGIILAIVTFITITAGFLPGVGRIIMVPID